MSMCMVHGHFRAGIQGLNRASALRGQEREGCEKGSVLGVVPRLGPHPPHTALPQCIRLIDKTRQDTQTREQNFETHYRSV